MSIKDSKIYTVIFTFVFAFIFVLILSVVNFATKDKVEVNQKIFKQYAILNSLGIKYSDKNDAVRKFDKNVKQKMIDGREVYFSSYNGIKRTAVIFSGDGLWGIINGVLSVDQDITHINGLDFISHNETPGLGGRIEEDWFKDQFRGEKLVDGKIIFSIGTGGNGDYDHENGKVDGISGATRTTESIQKIIKDNVEWFKKNIKGN